MRMPSLKRPQCALPNLSLKRRSFMVLCPTREWEHASATTSDNDHQCQRLALHPQYKLAASSLERIRFLRIASDTICCAYLLASCAPRLLNSTRSLCLPDRETLSHVDLQELVPGVKREGANLLQQMVCVRENVAQARDEGSEATGSPPQAATHKA
eukprot:3606082-Pyramimonas_sp.AAC.1